MSVSPNETILETIERRLIPDEQAKKARGEVFTPLNLVREMLYGLRKSELEHGTQEIWGVDNVGNVVDDTPDNRIGGIPLEVWRDPDTKWLDPANGIGNFPFVAFYMLDFQLKNYGIKGSKEWTDEKRQRHIVENMLYMIELDRGNVNTSFKVMNFLVKGSKPHICCANTLNLTDKDIQGYFGVTRFDVVMGNPPFQDPFKTGDNKLYLDFIQFSNNLMKPDGFVCFVVPKTSLEYLTMAKKRKYIDKVYNVLFLDDSESLLRNRHFPKVGSTFIYFIYKNSSDYEKTHVLKLIDGVPRIVDINLFEQNSLSPIDQAIMGKIFQDTPNYIFKDFTFEKGSTQRVRKQMFDKGIVSETPTPTHTVKIIVTLNVTNPFPGKFYYYTKRDVDMDKDKVVFSGSGYLLPTIDKTHEYTYSDNFKYILCDTNTCEELKLIFTSPIVEFISKKFKTSGFNDNTFFTKLSMIKPLKNVKTVDDIYKQLDLTEHKAYIESEVQKKKTLRASSRSPTRKTLRRPSK